MKHAFLYISYHGLLKDKCNNVKQNPIKNVFDATERNATGMRKTYVVHESYSTYDEIKMVMMSNKDFCLYACSAGKCIECFHWRFCHILPYSNHSVTFCFVSFLYDIFVSGHAVG